MADKYWASAITAATAASQCSFAAVSSQGAELTAVVEKSFMPFSWLAFHTLEAGAISIRVWLQGSPRWPDPATAFADNYATQYVESEVNGKAQGPLVFTGSNWAFAVIDTPTAGMLISGGTGPCPYG